MTAERVSSEQGSTSRTCMKSFCGVWSFRPVFPQIKSLCFVGFHLTLWCDLQWRNHKSQRHLHLQGNLIGRTSSPWPWSPRRTAFIHQPLKNNTKQKKKKKSRQQRSIYFSFVLLFAHRLTSNMSLMQKRMLATFVFEAWPVWQGVPTMIYCVLVTCGEDRFPTCTVEALLSCRAVILNPADLFNQEHWSRSRGEEVRIHRLSGPPLSLPLAQLSHCWPNTATLSYTARKT